MRTLAATLLLASLAVPLPGQRPAAKPAPRPAPRPVNRWVVDTTRSEMTDEPSVTLTLESANAVQGIIGETRPLLFIRCREQKLELFIHVSAVLDGDANENTVVRVRWGTDAPVEDTWSRSTDYQSAFAPDAGGFVAQLLAQPDMRFEFHPYDATPRVAVFDARGLKSHLKLVAAACPALGDVLGPTDLMPPTGATTPAAAPVPVTPAPKAGPLPAPGTPTGETNTFLAAVRTELRDLVVAEEGFFADSVRYSAKLSQLTLTPQPGVTITIDLAQGEGWRASGTHDHAPGWKCGIYVGAVAHPYTLGQMEGKPTCWQP